MWIVVLHEFLAAERVHHWGPQRLRETDQLSVPAQPAPARIVTLPAAFSTSAAAARDRSSGRIAGDTARTGVGCAPDGALARNTSPGTTTTATPPRCNATRIPISSSRGSWSGMLT